MPWGYSLPVASALLLVGCASDDAPSTETDRHTSPYPSCQAIIDACHPKDIGEGAVHDCHDVASNGPEASCSARKAECIATCNAAGN